MARGASHAVMVQLQDRLYRQNEQIRQIRRDNHRRRQALSASDAAVEDLSDRFDRSLSASHVTTTRVHSGALALERVVRLLSNDEEGLPAQPGAIVDPFEHESGETQRNGVRPALLALYTVTVCNLTDNEVRARGYDMMI